LMTAASSQSVIAQALERSSEFAERKIQKRFHLRLNPHGWGDESHHTFKVKGRGLGKGWALKKKSIKC
jgi:hypothetical protein